MTLTFRLVTRIEKDEENAPLLRANEVEQVALSLIDDSILANPEYTLEDLDAYPFSEDSIVTGLKKEEHGLWDLTTDSSFESLNAAPFSWDILEQEALQTTYFHVAESPIATPRRLTAGGSYDHGPEVTAYMRALQELVLGRSSVYFSYDSSSKSFVPTTKSIPHAVRPARGTIHALVEHGNSSKALDEFCKQGVTTSAPFLHALQLAIQDVLDVVTACVITLIVPDISTISEIWEKPRELILMLKAIVDELGKTEPCSACSAVEIVLTAQALTRPLKQALFAITCQSWLNECSRSIGLGAADFEMAELSMPDALDRDSSNMIKECSRLMQSILHDQPQHPLSAPSIFCITIPSLELGFCESDIARLEDGAEQYKHDIMYAIQQYHKGEVTSKVSPGLQSRAIQERSHPLHHDERSTMQQLQSSIAQFSNLPYLPRCGLCQKLHDACVDYLGAKSPGHQPAPQFEISALMIASIKPLLATQHSLLTNASLAATLHRHSLLKHLQIHHLFALLSSGTLAGHLKPFLLSPLHGDPTRQLDLSHALLAAWSIHFPSERPVTPALALSTTQHASSPATALCLSLPTPPALAPIFTPASTALYAAAFARLTTLLHARAILEALHLPCTRSASTSPHPRGRLRPLERLTLRFRLEAAHALDTLTLRFANGVARNWRCLTHELATAEASLHAILPADHGAVASVAGLAAAHATFLARVAEALLLPREGRVQAEVRAEAALEGLLACIAVGAGRVARWERGRGVRAVSQAVTREVAEQEERDWALEVRKLHEGMVRAGEALRVACAGFKGGRALARALVLEPGLEEGGECAVGDEVDDAHMESGHTEY